MPRRALSNKRPWLLLAIAAAVAFYLLRDEYIGGVYLIAIKGTAVGCLVLYALARHKGSDARILALALAFAALGDMAIELFFQAGVALFFAAHLAAMALFLHNRREHPTSSQKGLGVALLLVTPFLAMLLTHDMVTTLYALALGGMASSAWMSRFPRYRVGAGGVLFVLSDMLIIAQEGGQIAPDIAGWLIWPTYFLAQFLICTGVIQTLRRDHAA